MTTLIAFIAGISVTAIALFAPHARNPRTSVQEFESFQNVLSSLPVATLKNKQHTR